MSENDKTAAEKELAAKNIRVAVVVSLVAAGFYAAIVVMYM
jgi:hypothetical protein